VCWWGLRKQKLQELHVLHVNKLEGDEALCSLWSKKVLDIYIIFPYDLPYMNKMIAYCGLVCRTCPIYLVTREKNKEKQKEKRKEIVKLLKEHYGLEFKLEDITDCDGCTAETGRLFSACKDCPIRKCARKKKLESCAYCEEYACKTLEEFFAKEPSAKTRLEKIRDSSNQLNC